MMNQAMNKLCKHKATLAMAIATIVLTACGGGGGKGATKQNNINSEMGVMMREVADNNIIPAANGFQQKSTGLMQAVNNFCANKQESGLLSLQTAWKQTSEQWHRLLMYNFGPLTDSDPITLATTIAYIDAFREFKGRDNTATIRTDITTDLASSTVLSDTYFDGKEPKKVGLLALELLAFETSSGSYSTVRADIVAEYVGNSRKCDILQQQSRLLLKHANSIKNGWETDRSQYLNNQLKLDNAKVSSIKLLFISSWGYFDHLKSRDAVNQTAKVADYGWENISAAIRELEVFLKGTAATTVSIFDLMNSAGSSNAVAIINKNISDAKAAIQAKNTALLNIALGKIDGNLKETIPTALEIELGLNFTDGD